MVRRSRIVGILSFLLYELGLLSGTAYASDPADSVAQRRAQVIPLPGVYYSPETRIGYGLLGVCLFRAGPQARTSNIDLAAIYSQNKQLVIEPTYTIFTSHERYLLKGALLYTQFPEFYYGIGNETLSQNRELIAYDSFRSFNRFMRQLKPGWFVGVQQQYFKTFNVKRFTDNVYPQTTLIGELGSVTNGVGLASIVDTRDNIYSATKGWYAEVSAMAYQPLFGSQFTFANYLTDVRYYASLTPNTVLAGQLFGNLNVGTVPFKQAATLGGSMLMRGYYNGRFRDNHALVLQAEVRQRFIGRLGGVAFVSTGDVLPNLAEFSLADFKVTGGVGARFLISRKEHVNLRVDYAIGRQTQGIYFNISEAF